MRSVYLSLIILIAIHVSENSAAESCPVEKCMDSSHCDAPWNGAECANKQQICCSIVKREYQTACSHFGGECLERCNKDLQRSASNCPANKVCCVLV